MIGSDSRSTIIGVLNAMDEVVSSVERQIFSDEHCKLRRHHVGHRSEHSDKRLRCHPSVATADRASLAWLCTQNKPFERPLGNSYWRRCRVHQEVDRGVACLVAPRRRRFKLATTKVMGAVTVLEELPRRSMSVCTIWTTASLTSATLDRASTPIRPGGEYSDKW